LSRPFKHPDIAQQRFPDLSLVALIRTNRIQSASAENTNYGAEDIGLLKVKLGEFGNVVFNKVNSTLDVNRLKPSR
jgi:hypothetical protein